MGEVTCTANTAAQQCHVTKPSAWRTAADVEELEAHMNIRTGGCTLDHARKAHDAATHAPLSNTAHMQQQQSSA
jgi:hypothetical protein